MGIIREELTHGFLNAKRCIGVHGVLTFIHMEREVIANYRWEQYNITLFMQYTNEVVSADLIRKRMVQENSVAVLFLFNTLKQSVFDALAVC